MSRLTDLAIRNLPVPSVGQVTYADDGSPLKVRVSQGGSKSFLVMLGSGRRHVIGRYGIITLGQAREAAIKLKAEKTLGRVFPDRKSVEEVKTLYLAQAAIRPNTRRYYVRILNKLSGKLGDITPHEIVRLTANMHGPSRQLTIGVLKTFFAWCVENSYIDRSPAERVKARQTPPRTRVLSDEEVAIIWRACGPSGLSTDKQCRDTPISDTYAAIIKLLILTGMRRTEAAHLLINPSWIQNNTVTLPATLTKNKKQHHVPIGKLSDELLTREKSDATRNGQQSSTTGHTSKPLFNNWHEKDRLDALLGDRVGPWVLHDLRRSFASTHQRIGTPIHITELLLNHKSGSLKGIVGVYQRYSYEKELREATENYERWLIENVLK